MSRYFTHKGKRVAVKSNEHLAQLLSKAKDSAKPKKPAGNQSKAKAKTKTDDAAETTAAASESTKATGT